MSPFTSLASFVVLAAFVGCATGENLGSPGSSSFDAGVGGAGNGGAVATGGTPETGGSGGAAGNGGTNVGGSSLASGGNGTGGASSVGGANGADAGETGGTPATGGAGGTLDGHSQTITIQNATATALTDYQVRINLPDANPIFTAGHLANAAGNDIRIVQSDGVTAVPYWIEALNSGNAATKGRIWVKVTVPANGSVVVYLRYGLPADASSPLGNLYDPVTPANGVMEWGDDFSGTANGQPSASRWAGTIPATNIAALSGSGELLWKNTGTKTTGRLSSSYVANAPIIQETKMRTLTQAPNGVMGGGFYSAKGDNFGALIDGNTSFADYYYNNGVATGFPGSALNVDYRLTLQASGTTCSDTLTNYATGAVIYNYPSVTHTVANDHVAIGFMYEDNANLINQATDTRFDWILVRKYAPTPPTVTVPTVD